MLARMLRYIVILVVVLGALGGGTWWYLRQNTGTRTAFRTAPVQRGDLTVTITANGTVEPEEVVDVGAQVAGQILTFGKDKNGKTIDYGSEIEAGTVLARIDDSLYASDVAQAKAQLAQAQAGIVRAQADLLQYKAKLDQATRDWDRAQKLGPSEALAQNVYDGYKAAYDIAVANIALGDAEIVAAQATLAQAQAALDRAQRNLAYCTITSPVKGVVIDRRVNIGQTVVASLNAPSLFLIAKDLHRMQVWVSVNEADVGNIHPGQPVTFYVDAFPNQTFHGEVGKIRLNATMTQNVVTYTVEVVTDNSNGKLLPYLTANPAYFEVSRHPNVLQVPNAALRWYPTPAQVAPEYREKALALAAQQRGPRADRPSAAASQPAATQPRLPRGTIWVKAGDFVRPIPIRVGATDNTNTEVQGAELTEGLEVVLGVQTPDDNTADTSNPFAPSFRRRAR